MGLKDLHATLENNTYSGGYQGINQTDIPNNSDGTILSQPFIKKPLLGISQTNPGQFIDGISDGFIRGGFITAAERSLTDVVRVGKFMFTPNGITFNLRQTALQMSNPLLPQATSPFSIVDITGTTPEFGSLTEGGPLIDVSTGEGALSIASAGTYGLTSLLGNIIGQRNRTYNFGINTLAQIGMNAFGTHFDRAGMSPRWPEEDKFAHIEKLNADKIGHIKNRRIFGDQGKKETDYNRLLTLHSTIINQDYSDEMAYGSIEDPNLLTSWVTPYVIDLGQETNPILYTYPGGPDSKYGIGETVIGRYDNTTINNRGEKFDIPSNIAAIHGFSNTGQGSHFQTPIKNYLRSLGHPGTNYNQLTKDGKRFRREERAGLGNPGVGTDRKLHERSDPYIRQITEGGELNYNVYQEKRIDKVNMIDIFRADADRIEDIDGVRDMIPFRFEAIDSDDPTKSDSIVFRAFIDNINDNYKAQHNTVNYNGRAEDFYLYKSFNRDISFSFKIAAQSRHEMMPLYRKLNYLASNTAPEYNRGRIRTPFMRITIGNWLDRLPGVLSSISLKWQIDYPWEIALHDSYAKTQEESDQDEKGMDSHMQILPHVLDVSVSYQPIHNFLPQKSVTMSPFIMKHNDNGFIKREKKWTTLGVAGTETEGYVATVPNAYHKDISKSKTTDIIKEAGKLGVEKLEERRQSLQLRNFEEPLHPDFEKPYDKIQYLQPLKLDGTLKEIPLYRTRTRDEFMGEVFDVEIAQINAQNNNMNTRDQVYTDYMNDQ